MTAAQTPADHRADPVPPAPERRPVELVAHGDSRTDDWYWLRDKDDPAVITHLEAENAYTEAMTAGTKDLQETLFAEIVARIEETDLSVPVRKGPWLYYTRTVEGSAYAIHCRRPAVPGGRGGAGRRGPVAKADRRDRRRPVDPQGRQDRAVPPSGAAEPPTRASRCSWTRTGWPTGTSTSLSATSR